MQDKESLPRLWHKRSKCPPPFFIFLRDVVKSASLAPCCQLHQPRLGCQGRRGESRAAAHSYLSLQSLITYLSRLIGLEMLVETTLASPLSLPCLSFIFLPPRFFPHYASHFLNRSICIICVSVYISAYPSESIHVLIWISASFVLSIQPPPRMSPPVR